MPNTSYIPANPTPSGDNTRADDKPLPESIREGKSRAVQKNILKQKTEADNTKGSFAESKEKAKKKEEHIDNDFLIKKTKPTAKSKAKSKATAFPSSKTRTSALKFERARQSND